MQKLYKIKTLLLSAVLLAGSASMAQTSLSGKLTDDFVYYQTDAFQEKVFVHAVKSNFVAGETLFFKIYSVDGAFHRPLSLSKVCYVEILTPAGEAVVQTKVALSEGFGHGSIVLPDSLDTDQYSLVAYTSWMRNFGQEFFHRQPIVVLNPLEDTKPPRTAPAGETIRFFPEGGNLVDGFHTRVAFEGLGTDGQSITFEGTLLDDRGESLVTFKPRRTGIGSFSFTPVPGRRYHAMIKTEFGESRHDLPAASDSGFGLRLESTKKDVILQIWSAGDELNDHEVVVFVHSRTRAKKIKMKRMSGGKATFDFPLDSLADGITHFTVFDHQLRPRAERLFFKRPAHIATVEAQMLKGSFGRRNTAALTITTKDAAQRPVPANLSLSIFKIDALQSRQPVDIASYLLLTSDLRGRIEDPGYYFSDSEGAAEDADHLMMTHGWTRFRWDDIIARNSPITRFPPENEGHTIRMRVLDEHDQPLRDGLAFLAVPSKLPQFYASRSTSSGLLQFHTRDLFGRKEIVLQRIGGKINFNVESPFHDGHAAIFAQRPQPDPSNDELMRGYHAHRQVNEAFGENPFTTPTIDSIAVYGAPDKSYLLSDYVRFPLVEDVIREYVPDIIVRRRERKTNLFVLDRQTQVFFETEPLVLLDGIPVFDTDLIIGMPAQNIYKLDVVMKKFYLGRFAFTGVVSFTTAAGLEGTKRLNPDAIILDYEGLQIAREYYSPVYNGVVAASERMPDFRNVLAWQPDIDTGADGRADILFHTSDLPGTYLGVVQGISPDGSPGATTFTFEVGSGK